MKKLIVILLLASLARAEEFVLLYPLLIGQASDAVVETENMSESQVYRIEPGDVLEIMILGEEELSRTLMVLHNGMVSFPLIGEVKISGLTTDEAASLISTELKKYFTYPVVSVILKSPTNPQVSVFGEVQRPGAVEYQRGLRIVDYIALAGGPTVNANLSRVNVVRFLEGRPIAQTIDVADILTRGRLEKNYELKSGDWMYVHKKFTINWSIVIQTLTLAVAAVNLYYTIDHLKQ